MAAAGSRPFSSSRDPLRFYFASIGVFVLANAALLSASPVAAEGPPKILNSGVTISADVEMSMGMVHHPGFVAVSQTNVLDDPRIKVAGSLFTLSGTKDSGLSRVALSFSSEHVDERGPLLASSSGDFVPFHILVDGVPVVADGPLVFIADPPGSDGAVIHRVTFDLNSSRGVTVGPDYQDTVTVQIIP